MIKLAIYLVFKVDGKIKMYLMNNYIFYFIIIRFFQKTIFYMKIILVHFYFFLSPQIKLEKRGKVHPQIF